MFGFTRMSLLDRCSCNLISVVVRAFAVSEVFRKQNIIGDLNLDHTQIQVQIHNTQNNTSGVSFAQQKSQ